jgi:hypothetical protein
MPVDTLRVATLGSLNYRLSTHHLRLKLSLDIADSWVLNWKEVDLKDLAEQSVDMQCPL